MTTDVAAQRTEPARRYVDLHVQFRHGTSLETAHRLAHDLQDLIEDRLDRTDVLIHLEPEDRVRPGEVLPAPDDSRAIGGPDGLPAALRPG